MAVNVTVILQAASDSRMTETNNPGGSLSDSDPRKMYGLPNIRIDQHDKLYWADKPRWDEVTKETQIPRAAGKPLYKTTAPYVKTNPTTTAFQLRCEDIRHEFMDMSAISPLPAFDIRDGTYDSVGTPGQLNNIVIALGLRTEVIKLSGVLVDRGPVTAANPRRQTLLNIARTQYLKISRGGKKNAQEGVSDETRATSGWGGVHAGPLNPRSFPCLSLFHDINILRGSTLEQDFNFGYSIGTEPSGDSRQYRGIIKDLTFRLVGGRPDIWEWDMSFAVVNNEHSHQHLVKPDWQVAINRIRQVDARDGSRWGASTTAAADGFGYVEVRLASTPQHLKQDPDDPNGDPIVLKSLQHGDSILISGTNSTPTINGWWNIRHVDIPARTLILSNPAEGTNIFGIDTVWESQYNRGNSDNEDTGIFEWQEDQWTDGNTGYALWEIDEGVLGPEQNLLLLP